MCLIRDTALPAAREGKRRKAQYRPEAGRRLAAGKWKSAAASRGRCVRRFSVEGKINEEGEEKGRVCLRLLEGEWERRL